jgi:hypothetical protein
MKGMTERQKVINLKKRKDPEKLKHAINAEIVEWSLAIDFNPI